MAEMATTEKLAVALTLARAPHFMIDLARAGYYDEFRSHLPDPITTLILDAITYSLYDLAERASKGEFHASFSESEQWGQSPEGKAMIKAYLGDQWLL